MNTNSTLEYNFWTRITRQFSKEPFKTIAFFSNPLYLKKIQNVRFEYTKIHWNKMTSYTQRRMITQNPT